MSGKKSWTLSGKYPVGLGIHVYMLGLDRECWFRLLLGKISNVSGQIMCVCAWSVKCKMSNVKLQGL